jgi:myo-inositol-1(or 4)-monophosphatase
MYSSELLELKKSIYQKLHELRERELEINQKKDKSFVTEFDIFISDEVKRIFKKRHPDFHFFSEEDQESFDFPLVVLDPIDGTREYVKGYGECAVSLAVLNSADVSDPKNFGWIYNPFTGFEITNNLAVPIEPRENLPETTHVMISRSEWEKKLLPIDSDQKVRVTPMGSIAYKLGLLAAGACDVVISMRPKSVWDIAAGVVICHSRGIKSISNGSELTHLSEKRYQDIFIFGKDCEIERAKILIE